MPWKTTTDRAQKDLKQGKRPTTAGPSSARRCSSRARWCTGEFVREEMEHVRRGKHGARSSKQAIAIGLSKARRAGVPLPPPRKGQAKERTRRSAEAAYEVGQGRRKPRAPSRKRGKAVERALRREPRSAASHAALSKQAKAAARRRKRR